MAENVEKYGGGLDAPRIAPPGMAESEHAESVDLGKADGTHRRLKPRHIQLIGIGGTIGTMLYVQIGKGLIQGGPGSLFLAFTLWCTVILAVTFCLRARPRGESSTILHQVH